MFPTRARDKIPKSLTYPIKAKFISESLADMPQADKFQLWFSNSSTPAELRKATQFRLAQVRYLHWKPSRFMPRLPDNSEFANRDWSIEIYAVPVEIRARVMQLLQEEALPEIRAWLHEKAEFANLRSCSIAISYDEAADELGYFRHNSL